MQLCKEFLCKATILFRVLRCALAVIALLAELPLEFLDSNLHLLLFRVELLKYALKLGRESRDNFTHLRLNHIVTHGRFLLSPPHVPCRRHCIRGAMPGESRYVSI